MAGWLIFITSSLIMLLCTHLIGIAGDIKFQRYSIERYMEEQRKRYFNLNTAKEQREPNIEKTIEDSVDLEEKSDRPITMAETLIKEAEEWQVL